MSNNTIYYTINSHVPAMGPCDAYLIHFGGGPTREKALISANQSRVKHSQLNLSDIGENSTKDDYFFTQRTAEEYNALKDRLGESRFYNE